MKDRAWFLARLRDIEQQKLQARAHYNALEGAEQFCRQALDELDAIPLEDLVGAVDTTTEG